MTLKVKFSRNLKKKKKTNKYLSSNCSVGKLLNKQTLGIKSFLLNLNTIEKGIFIIINNVEIKKAFRKPLLLFNHFFFI